MRSLSCRFAFVLTAALSLSLPSRAQIYFWPEEIASNYGVVVSAFVVDVNSDSILDVVSAGRNSNEVRWWQNDGEGHFTEHFIGTLSNLEAIVPVDMGNDGDVDLIGVGMSNVSNLDWWENDGNGNFMEHVIATAYGRAWSVAAGDVDGDGDEDIVSPNEAYARIDWWENDGQQNFTRHSVCENCSAMRSVWMADVNTDHHIDIFSGSRSAVGIQWWENDGSQVFTPHTINATFTDLPMVLGVDLDGNRTIDLLAGAGQRGLNWFENDENGNFTLHLIDSTYSCGLFSYSSFLPADLNNDGLFDVIGGGWYENTGDMNFTRHGGLPTAYCYDVGDLNGDGRTDVVAGNTQGLFWYRQDTIPPPPDPITSLIEHNAGNIAMAITNYGVEGNPSGVPGYHGFEFPINSGSNFLFSAGLWVGAIVNNVRLVSTTVDGDNGTGEFWPLSIGTYPSVNHHTDTTFGDWYLSSSAFSQFGDKSYVRGAIRVDDDGDWNAATDDLDGNGHPSSNYDLGHGIIGVDDDGDGLIDEDSIAFIDGHFVEIDADNDGNVADTGPSGDHNHDGNCDYDPETHIDEDPAGDISHDYVDNDHDGLVDMADPDYDGDLNPGFADDDNDGAADEDGKARGDQEFFCAYHDDISPSQVRHPDSGGHTPLHIVVTQTSFARSDSFSGAIIPMEFRIRNVGDQTLNNVYLAMFADPDIAAPGETGDAASACDGNYFDSTRMMAIQGKFGFWNGAPTPGLFAIKVLRTPVPMSQLQLSFANYGRLSGGDPPTNTDKYQVISSGQISPRTPQMDDQRFVLGFGAEGGGFMLAPGDELPITVAFLSGANLEELDRNADRAMRVYNWSGPAITEQTLVTPERELGPYVVSAYFYDEDGVAYQDSVNVKWMCRAHGNQWSSAPADSYHWADPTTFSGTYFFTIPATHSDGDPVAQGDTILFFCDGYDRMQNYSAQRSDSIHAGFDSSDALGKPQPTVPREYALYQNYPNPFNPTTTIRFDLKNAGTVRVKIYDILGREVATLLNEKRAAGSYSMAWDASALPSGMYLCRMEAGSFVQTKKLLLLR